jgi:endonuclease/exonuclease/phosphatase family metal-dependent hydrolase
MASVGNIMVNDMATGAGTSFRFVSWNLQWSSSAEQRLGQLELIRQLAPDLLAVQEVKAPTLRPLEALFDWKVFALGPRPDDRYWTSRVGTAVLGKASMTLESQMLISPTWFGLDDRWRVKANRFARRAAWARVRPAGCADPLLVGSLHASPATGPIGAHKPWFHAGVGRWLAEVQEPWLFGIDANTPGVDHPDPNLVEWCWAQTDDQPGEDELLGDLAAHRGRDLLRDWLAQHPEELQAIRSDRPEGPLAVSYHLASGPVRYDHCWATPEITVENIEYLEEALAHSDHAPIICDLTLSDVPGSQDSQAGAKPNGDRSYRRMFAANWKEAVMDEKQIRRVLNAIPGDVEDIRGNPDSRRRAQFKAGWRNYAVRDRRYTERALQRLTWNNLGYRLAQAEIEPAVTENDELDEIFDAAAHDYEGSRRRR